MHDDFDITDFSISILVGHFEPHWYGYGYLTFLFSSLNTFVGYLWHIIVNDWMSLHNYLVYLILQPREILIFNRIGFFVALCIGIYLAGSYIRKKTDICFALIFLSGVLITNSFYFIKLWIKSQSIDIIWVVLSLGLAEKLYESPTKKTYILAGCILGLAWSTSLNGLILAICFFVTIIIYQVNASINKNQTIVKGLISIGWLVGAFCISYLLTSPFAIISFNDWYLNITTLMKQGEMIGFTWDKSPSLEKTMTYLGFNSIFPAIVIIILFFSFVFDEIREKSLKYLHGIIFVLVCLFVYSRSPHVRIYYYFAFTVVMTIFALIFLYRIGKVYRRISIIIPLILFCLVVYTNMNTPIMFSFFNKHYFEQNNGYTNSNILKQKEWINHNLDTNGLVILDGFLHFIPPITCADSVINSDLWGHYRYGRQYNNTMQRLVNEAWQISKLRGDKIFHCARAWVGYEYNEERMKRIKEIIVKSKYSPVYYVVPFEWYKQYVGIGMNISDKQIKLVDYYKDLLEGNFGNVIFKDNDLAIIKLDLNKINNFTKL